MYLGYQPTGGLRSRRRSGATGNRRILVASGKSAKMSLKAGGRSEQTQTAAQNARFGTSQSGITKAGDRSEAGQNARQIRTLSRFIIRFSVEIQDFPYSRLITMICQLKGT